MILADCNHSISVGMHQGPATAHLSPCVRGRTEQGRHVPALDCDLMELLRRDLERGYGGSWRQLDLRPPGRHCCLSRVRYRTVGRGRRFSTGGCKLAVANAPMHVASWLKAAPLRCLQSLPTQTRAKSSAGSETRVRTGFTAVDRQAAAFISPDPLERVFNHLRRWLPLHWG